MFSLSTNILLSPVSLGLINSLVRLLFSGFVFQMRNLNSRRSDERNDVGTIKFHAVSLCLSTWNETSILLSDTVNPRNFHFYRSIAGSNKTPIETVAPRAHDHRLEFVDSPADQCAQPRNCVSVVPATVIAFESRVFVGRSLNRDSADR